MERREFIRTPVTQQTNWLMSAGGGRCDFFEKKWIQCASKLGLTRAEKDCAYIKEDVRQCGQLELSNKRYQRMQEERQKRGLPYQEPPPYDTLTNERFKHMIF